MQLKLCESGDLPALLELARLGHAESTDYLPLDVDKVTWWIRHLIAKHLVLGVETEAGELVGSFALDTEAPRYSSAIALWDIALFVRPDHRRSNAATLLIGGAKAIAADMGLPLFVEIRVGTDLERKERLFTRAGFKPLGMNFIWRPK